MPLTNVRVEIYVRREQDSAGPLQNSLFVINAPDFTGDLDNINGGTVPANGDGSVSWLLIPLGEAAPTPASEYYEVSGLLTYSTDGNDVTVDLWPDSIEVRFARHRVLMVGQVVPDPKLTVQYFWQRDVSPVPGARCRAQYSRIAPTGVQRRSLHPGDRAAAALLPRRLRQERRQRNCQKLPHRLGPGEPQCGG